MSTEERLLKLLQAPADVQAAIDRILDGKAAIQSDAASNGPLLMGMGAAAKFLGVSRATLWRMIQAGRLEKVEVLPNSFRVRRADLEAIAAGRKGGGDETGSVLGGDDGRGRG
jgi:excisionase family DNA binding protein